MPGFELFETVFRTRFTDLGATMFTHQKMGKCGDFELKMMNCMEAYGKPLGDTKCKDLVDDFSECITNAKKVLKLLKFFHIDQLSVSCYS